jgi:hypothetical protein
MKNKRLTLKCVCGKILSVIVPLTGLSINLDAVATAHRWKIIGTPDDEIATLCPACNSHESAISRLNHEQSRR